MIIHLFLNIHSNERISYMTISDKQDNGLPEKYIHVYTICIVSSVSSNIFFILSITCKQDVSIFLYLNDDR